jgi:hypothetical protein
MIDRASGEASLESTGIAPEGQRALFSSFKALDRITYESCIFRIGDDELEQTRVSIYLHRCRTIASRIIKRVCFTSARE